MYEKTVEEKIKEIIISQMNDQSKIDTLTYTTPLLSLGIDSILSMSILVEIEKAYDIKIDNSNLNLDKIKDIASFARLIKNYLKK